MHLSAVGVQGSEPLTLRSRMVSEELELSLLPEPRVVSQGRELSVRQRRAPLT